MIVVLCLASWSISRNLKMKGVTGASPRRSLPQSSDVSTRDAAPSR
jgi:hypothetical protein